MLTVWKDFEITGGSSPTKYQGKIRAYRHEVNAISDILKSQLGVWDDLSAAVRNSHIAPKNSERLEYRLPLLGEHRLEQFFQSRRNYLLTKIEIFKTMDLHLQELVDWQGEQAALRKNRQEEAIVALTFVSVLFLPLSWLSGVLGMNTADSGCTGSSPCLSPLSSSRERSWECG